ncbi:hypothetical protein BGX26_011227 [Mortierella sp. AD094]|nr:hypothetical protein BGX26_011227 [Mortierella sp. AD094]
MSIQVDNPTMVQHSYQMMPGETNLSYADPANHAVTQSHYESAHHQNHSTYVDETAPDEDSEFEDAQDALEALGHYTQGEFEEYSVMASRPDSELQEVYGHERQVTQEQQQQHYVQSIPDSPAEEIIRLVDTIPHVDLAGELEKIKARLAVLVGNSQLDMDSEIAALLELEKSTETLIISRKTISEKQRQFILLHINDGRRPSLQAELIQLINENKVVQHQWSVSMEVYHQDYVVAAAAAAAEAAAKANAELKATLENDVKILKSQIANLQRQLDAVASRRRQMLADAEEQHKIMRRNYARS